MEIINMLTLNIAKIVINEVEKKAIEGKTPVVITISNEWGMPIAIHFMDGALPASFDISMNKAFTSSTVRISTLDLKKLSKDGGDLQGIENTNNNKIIAFPGGFPIEINNKVLGAIGVSGGTAEYDNMLALYGKKICEGVLKWKTMKKL